MYSSYFLQTKKLCMQKNSAFSFSEKIIEKFCSPVGIKTIFFKNLIKKI